MSSYQIEFLLGGQQLVRGCWATAEEAERYKAELLRTYPDIERAEVMPGPGPGPVTRQLDPDAAVLIDLEWWMGADGLLWARFNGQLYGVQRLPGESRADFIKDDGEVYTVTARSCTCPDRQYRQRTCKHMGAAADMRLWDEQAAASSGRTAACTAGNGI